MKTITLPWPPVELNPNSRVHYMALSRAKKSYRLACWACAKEQGVQKLEPGPLDVELAFYPPDRRSYDVDNLLARAKALLDGLSDALGIDDKHFRPTVRLMPNVGGMVKVTLGSA